MTPPDLELLLAEEAWLRRLATSLVRDPALADDLVQETWLAALKRPFEARSARAWLAGTLRNLWRENRRGEGRRSEREERSAKDEATAATDELVAELSQRRAVVDALLGLEEPYRSLLFRRFFRDESLKSLAKANGVAVSTVHARLERGLALLRERLDAEHGGDRRIWMAGLLAIVERPTLGAPWTAPWNGGLAMSTATKATVVAALVAGTVGIWARLQSGAETEAARDEVLALPAAPAAEPELEPAAPTVRGARRSSVSEPEAPVAAEAPRVAHRGVVLSMDGGPRGGLELNYRDGGFEERCTSLGDGTFELALPEGLDGDPARLRPEEAWLQVVAATVAVDGSWILVTGPRLRLGGTVVDPEGLPLPEATVALRMRHSLFRDLGVKQSAYSEPETWKVRSDASGAFFLNDTVGGEHVFLEVRKPGYQDATVELAPQDQTGLQVVLEPMVNELVLSGVVLSPEDRPVEGARVSLGSVVVTTLADGLFELRWTPGQPRGGGFAQGEDGVWRVKNEETHVAAIAPGYGPVRLPLTAEMALEPLVLRLPAEPGSIEGRVVDPRGNGLAGIVVWVSNPTHFGRRWLTSGENSATLSLTLEEELTGERGTRTDEEGRFVLSGLLDQSYEVQAYDPRSASYGSGWSLDVGQSGVRLVLEPDPSATRVAGVVRSASGRPHANLAILPLRRGGEDWDLRPPQSPEAGVLTDAEGRFEFPSLAVEGTRLELNGEGVFYQLVQLADHPDPAHLDIVVPVLCELRVTLSDPKAADEIRVLDAEGEAVDMYVHQGVFISMSDEAKLEDGKSSVLEIPELATTVVFLRGGQEVGSLPVSPRPGSRVELVY